MVRKGMCAGMWTRKLDLNQIETFSWAALARIAAAPQHRGIMLVQNNDCRNLRMRDCKLRMSKAANQQSCKSAKAAWWHGEREVLARELPPFRKSRTIHADVGCMPRFASTENLLILCGVRHDALEVGRGHWTRISVPSNCPSCAHWRRQMPGISFAGDRLSLSPPSGDEAAAAARAAT